MAVTFTSNYREIFSAETLEKIDGFVESQYDLGCMLEFIDEHSEKEFAEYYEEYVELGEDHGYEAVDAFLVENDLSDLKNFEAAYIGEFQSPERMAEDYFEEETARLDYRISLDWEETAKFLLDHEVDRHGDHYFRNRY
jgi:hypothetical protein